MLLSKILKITIPIIIVISIGVIFSFSALSPDTTEPVSIESSVNFEINNTTSNETKTDTKLPRVIGEFNVTSTQKVIETIGEDDILGKTIPPNYKFGNFFDNGLLVGMDWTDLENSEQIHSIRFTNKHAGEISVITLELLVHSTREAIVGIQEDNGAGYPSGTWNNDQSYVKTILPPTQEKSQFELPQSFKVSNNKVYHIVIQLGPPLPDNLISDDSAKDIAIGSDVKVIHYKKNTPYQPFNPEDPDIYWSDTAINSLHYTGTEWVVLDKWPIYLLRYVDGAVDGQPYTLKAHWVVNSKRSAGQTIIPHSDYKVSKFGFLVNKKGNPVDDLFYGVKDLNNNLLASGLFAKSNDLTKRLSFIEVSLGEPIDLKAGNLYRFYVYSDIPRGDDHYNLYGHEFSLNNTAGYGGEIHRLTTSGDFEHWGPWYDADAVFALTTSP